MFYHGTSSVCGISYKLLPPVETGVVQEKGRLKNLSKIFFTTDIGSAKVYAGRSVRQFGGTPIVYRVIPMGEIVCLNDTPGTSVYMADWGFVEEV